MAHGPLPLTALMVIDLQVDFCDPQGAYARNGMDTSGIRAIVPRIAEVARACKAARVPVIATKYTIWCDLDGRPIGIDHILGARPFLAREGFRRGSPGCAVIPDLPPPDYEIEKTRFSAFYSTMLEGLLRSLKVRRLVFTGIATHAGIESTARDASVRDFEVTVLSDCVTTFDPAMQTASLKTMTAIGRVVPSKSFLQDIAPPESAHE